MTAQSNSNRGGAGLTWQSLHEWAPPEGTWAILWPGYYGPFMACWIHGRWTMCEDSDFDCATIGAELALPHLVTDAVPFFDRIPPMTDQPTTPAQVAVKPDLLPCPFCGGEASDAGYAKFSPPLKDAWWDNGEEISEAFFCNCTRCGVSNQGNIAGYRTQEQAVKAWNRRIPAPSPEEQEPVAWTGSGSLMALKDGREGFIWPQSADAHPIPLYTHPAPVPAVPDDVADLIADIRTEQAVGDIRSAFADHLVATIEAQAAELAQVKELLEEAREWNWIDFEEAKKAGDEVEAFLPDLCRLDAEITAALTQPADASNEGMG